MSTGPCSSLTFSSDSYIVIRSVPLLCRRVLLVACLPFGIDTVGVGGGSFLFDWLCSGAGRLVAPLPRVSSPMLLFVGCRVDSGGWFSGVVPVVGVSAFTSSFSNLPPGFVPLGILLHMS